MTYSIPNLLSESTHGRIAIIIFVCTVSDEHAAEGGPAAAHAGREAQLLRCTAPDRRSLSRDGVRELPAGQAGGTGPARRPRSASQHHLLCAQRRAVPESSR